MLRDGTGGGPALSFGLLSLGGETSFWHGKLLFCTLSPFQMAYLALAVSKSGAWQINRNSTSSTKGMNLLYHGSESDGLLNHFNFQASKLSTTNN